MNALFRKEFRHLAVPFWFVAQLVVVCVSVAGNEVIEVGEPSFGGNDGARAVFAVFALLGAGLGYFQFQSERSHATESYLVHRRGGHAAAFRAKVLAAWLAFAIWIALGVLAFVVRTWLFDPAVGVARWESLGDMVWVVLSFVPAHAFGAFAALLRAGPSTRMAALLATAGGTIVVGGFASRDVFGNGAASVPLYLCALAAIATLGLQLGARMFAGGDDRDLPFAPRIGLLGAAVVLACTVPLIENVLSSYQRAAVVALEARRPVIVVDEDRAPFLLAEGDEGWRRVDPETGERLGQPLVGFRPVVFGADSPYTLVFGHERTPLEWSGPSGDPTRLRVSRAPFLFSGSWQHVVLGGTGEWSVWLGSKNRRVVAYRRTEGELERVALARPDGNEFSERTAIVYGGGADGHGGVLVDLADGTAWRVRRDGPTPVLAAVALPDGDRIVGVEQLQSVARVRTGTWEPFGYSDVLAVVGERGRYVLTGDGFFAWNRDGVSVAPADFDGRVEFRVRRVGGDRLSPIVSVLDARTERELLRHDFGPTTLLDTLIVGAARAFGLARAPVVTTAGLALGPAQVRAAKLEVALHAVRPIWFVHFALVALMLLDVHRRLASAGRVTRIFWFVSTLLLGLVAWAACRGLEPRCARRPSSLAPSPAREPLLVTA